ncbi:RNA helicase [Ranunculus cassubicifolius]
MNARVLLLGLLKQPSKSPSSLRNLCNSAPSIDPSLPLPPQLSTENLTPTETKSDSDAQLLNLIQSPNENWNQGSLLNLTSNISPIHLPQLLRRLNNSSQALKFLQWLQTNAPSILLESQPVLYQSIFDVAAREDQSHVKLEEILKTCKVNNVPLTVHSASVLIRHFSRAKMISKSFEVFNDFDPFLKNTRLCNSFLDSLYKSGLVVDARKLFDEMLQPESSFPPDDETACIVFGELVKRDNVVNGKDVVKLVSDLAEHGVFPEADMLRQLMIKLCRNDDLGPAWDVLHLVMQGDAGSVEGACINPLLAALGRQNNFEKMNLLLSDMKEVDVKPNRISFEIIVRHLCKLRRIGDALKVFDMMKKEKENGWITAVPDLVMYNLVIKGLCKLGRQDEALSLVDYMRSEHGHAPDTVTWNALLDGFCKAGEIEKARELFDQMKEEGVTPNVITLNTLIDGLCKHGRVSSALQFFSDMQSTGLKGNAITYTSLINAFCYVNNLDKATDLFNEMVSAHVTPDSILYYTLINGFIRGGRLDAACSVASRMKSLGFSLDAKCYNILINAFCKRKNMDRVYDLINEMEDAGVQPDEVTYNTLISNLSKSGEFSIIRNLMTKMTAEGFAPTVVTYGAVIHGYCKAGKLNEAFEIFNLMGSTTKVPPSTVIYNILIDSLCKEKKIDDALALMDGMKGKGVLPNVLTYNAIFKGLREMNMLDNAYKLMDRMNEEAINPDYITLEILTEWLSSANEIATLKRFVKGYEVSV